MNAEEKGSKFTLNSFNEVFAVTSRKVLGCFDLFFINKLILVPAFQHMNEILDMLIHKKNVFDLVLFYVCIFYILLALIVLS